MMQRRHAWGRWTAGILLAAAAHAAPLMPEAERLQLADGLYAREMYAPAAAEYEGFLLDHPGSAQTAAAVYRLGESYRALGRTADADKQFMRAAQESPDSEFGQRAAFRRADIYLEGGKPEIAASMYRALLDRKPIPEIAAAACFFLADALAQTNQREQALEALGRIRVEFKDSTYYAYALLKLGELGTAPGATPGDEVLALLQEALDHAPTDRVAAEARFQLAAALDARSEYSRSTAQYAQLLEKHPQDARAPLARLRGAWAAHNAGLHADALRMVDAALAGTPDAEREDWLYLKANCERQLVRHEDALKTYEAQLAQFPRGRLASAAQYEKALTLYRMGRYADAAEFARDLPQSAANRKDVYWLLAESFAALKRDDDAIQYYRLIATEFPRSDIAADATYRLAFKLQSRGNALEAARFFRQLAADSPTNRLAPQALFAAGMCLAQARQDADAVQSWTQLTDQYADSSFVEEALYRKGLSEVRLERREDALKTLQALLTRSPQSTFAADAHFWRGVMLRDGGNANDAERELQACLKAKPGTDLERECRFHLTLLLHQRGAYPEAAEQLYPLLTGPMRERLTPSLLQWLAEYECAQNRPGRGAEAAEALVAVSTNAVGRQTGYALLGRARAAEHRVADAVRALEQALAETARTPFTAEAALRLGGLMLQRDDADAATRYFEQAAAATDDTQGGLRAHAYAGLGRAAKARGDHEAAARFFMSVAVLYDDAELVPESLCEAALAFQQLGRTADARQAADELRARHPTSPWVERLPVFAAEPPPPVEETPHE